MAITRLVAGTLVTLALLPPHSFGQEGSKKAEVSPMGAVLGLHLPHRDGVASLYYSPCCADRAIETQESIRDFIAFYRKKLGIDNPIAVAVLDERDWDRIRQQKPSYRLPYGMPNFQAFAFGYVLFVPADDKGVVSRHVLGDRQHSTVLGAKILAAAHVTYDEAVTRVILQLAHHEAGHTRVYEYGIQPPNLWLNEMLANYFAYAYEKARDHQTAITAEAFVKTGFAPGAYTYTSLEDFEAHSSNIQPANYDWYQLQFGVRAFEIYNEQGLEFLEEVKKAFPRGTPKMTVAETLSRLETISPGFQAWAKKLSQNNPEAVRAQ